MQSILTYHLPRLRTLCRRYHVQNLWAVGSVLREDFGPSSDIDLLYDWDRPAIADEDFLYFYESFKENVRQTLGRPVDFIPYSRLRNPFLIEEFNQTKVLLYAKKGQQILGRHAPVHS